MFCVLFFFIFIVLCYSYKQEIFVSKSDKEKLKLTNNSFPVKMFPVMEPTSGLPNGAHLFVENQKEIFQ